MKKVNNEKEIGFIDVFKKKLIETGSSYIKKNMDKTKGQILNYVEKNIENKIKKEIKKSIFKLISAIILSIGILFLIYGGIEILILTFSLPIFLTNIFFGISLIIISFIIYY